MCVVMDAVVHHWKGVAHCIFKVMLLTWEGMLLGKECGVCGLYSYKALLPASPVDG